MDMPGKASKRLACRKSVASQEVGKDSGVNGTGLERRSLGVWDTRKGVITSRLSHRGMETCLSDLGSRPSPRPVKPLSELRVKVRGMWWEEWLT